MVEIIDGHVYLTTLDPIEKVGKAIAEEFSNWKYNAEDNMIYQTEDEGKFNVCIWVILVLAGVLMAFIYPAVGFGLLVGLLIIGIIWGYPGNIDEPVDFITIYEQNEDNLRTYVDFQIFDDNGEQNLTDDDIMNITNRIEHRDESRNIILNEEQ